MFKRRFIVTCSLLFALIIGSIIDNAVGFEKGYLAISIAALACGYWIVEFLIDLILYYFSYESGFKFYVAEKVNKTNLSHDDIMKRKKHFYKEFKRTMLKGKLYEYLKLFFAMGLFILLIVSLF